MEALGRVFVRAPASSEEGSGPKRQVSSQGGKQLRMLRGQTQAESRSPAKSSAQARESFCVSDVGCERDLNEDRFDTVRDGSAITWLVCDGMGGAAGGEFAAQLAVDAMTRSLQQSRADEPNIDVLSSAFREANRVILLRRRNPELSGMGTTAVAMRFDGTEAVIASIGDSRAYLVRDGAVQQLTVDDTYVQSLVDEGRVMAEDALSHPEAHVLTRCLGSEPNLNVHSQRLWLWPAEMGGETDVVVLCTDGLYSLISDAEIGGIASSLAPQEACEKLVQVARQKGGYDNITVAIIPVPGTLRPAQPAAIPTEKASHAKRKAHRANRGVFKHVMLLALMAACAAAVTVIGTLALQFLR